MVEAVRQSKGPEVTQRPAGTVDSPLVTSNLTPKEIVAELDRYIIGQNDAKRAVAVALRNRYRRQQLPEELRREVHPRNILMIGSTGVGKTEIARRVARIVDAPFIKVEATKFTEVGYVGRDVESIIRDLLEIAISMLHSERLEAVKEEATRAAVERLAEIMAENAIEEQALRSRKKRPATPENPEDAVAAAEREARAAERKRRKERDRLLELLSKEAMEDETVEIELDDDSDLDDAGSMDFVPGMMPDELQESFMELLDGLMPRRRTRRRMPVKEARRILAQQEAYRMVDVEAVVEEAVRRVEENAVVFIDELDKTVSSDSDGGPDVSGEGVQRDLLPIIEGSTVMTRYGPVETDHILFIAAGAFHNVRPSDLIPELQGRFPVRVELHSLSEQDLYAILTEPQNALTRQYLALLETEGVTLEFPEGGLRAVAQLATLVNQRTEDIGARRLQTIMERVLEEVSFDAPDMQGQQVMIDEAYVVERVGDVAVDDELSNFIL